MSYAFQASQSSLLFEGAKKSGGRAALGEFMQQVFVLLIKWHGLILLLLGIYSLLIAYKVLPIKSQDPQFVDNWYKKYGKMKPSHRGGGDRSAEGPHGKLAQAFRSRC